MSAHSHQGGPRGFAGAAATLPIPSSILTSGAGKRGLAGAVPQASGEAGHRVPGGWGPQTGRARPGGEPHLHHNIYPGLLLLPSRQLVAAGSQLHVLPHLHHAEPAGPGINYLNFGRFAEKNVLTNRPCDALLAPHLFVLGLVFLISCFWLIDLMNI